MTSLHFNNHVSSQQHASQVGLQLFEAIVETGVQEITLSVDDGDGDVRKYSIVVKCERLETVRQMCEN